MKAHILIVEDDRSIARLMAMHLEQAGFATECVYDGHEAVHRVKSGDVDLVILDRMLPKLDGMKVLRWLRSNEAGKTLPVLMVTALGQPAERVMGLEHGADDYLPKPFEPMELIARVRALLRRSMPRKVLRCGPIELDSEAPSVRVHGVEVALRPLEFRLLYALMSTPGKVRTRTNLLDQVWGQDAFVEPRTVDVAVKRLRKTLAAFGAEGCIETVRGLGYRIKSQFEP